jgi:DNA-binding LytR/AlgR family response regulator
LDSMQQKQRMNKVFDGILLVPGTPKENWGSLEESLRYSLYYIHKSFLVNVSHIKEYSKEGGSFIVLKNGRKLTVSHRRKDKFAREFLKTL